MNPSCHLKKIVIAASCALALATGVSRASIAYGSINNFDTVNDTGSECHGFEIELEDCHSTDITYTYNYNHYGVPKITEDNSLPAHPKCVIRWESKKNPDGSWAAFTAVPVGPIAPTNGHMFTNPAVNFGGEHFGTGYRVQPTAVRYHWLIDNGAGTLVQGGAVQVSTPAFTYYPPVVVGVPAPPQVQAVIAPPPPPAPEPKEFGKAVWVKEIRTTTHNNNEVKLRDLISDDPDDADDKNWRNGEPDEVEAEWQVLQKDYHKAEAPNNKLVAAAEDLPGGDEVVTRRYEFYKYTGPLDDESGEAMAQSVAADGIHGVGLKLINGVEVDLSTVAIVGAFTGSQMAAVDVDAQVGLIDHVGEGTVDTPFAGRTVVVEGARAFTSVREGPLPAGMAFDEVSGELSGTPTESGDFIFKITADDGLNPEVSKNYTLRIAAAGAALPPESLVDTAASPPLGGTTTGDGAFAPGENVTVTATAADGFHFVNWTDNGKVVGNASSYVFVIDVNHSLVANFAVNVPQWNIATSATPPAGGGTSGGGMVDTGSSATVIATPNAGYAFANWTDGVGGIEASTAASYTFTATADRTLVANFTPTPTYAVSASAAPVAGGTASGGGNHASGTSVTVVATEAPGYVFTGWKIGTALVSSSPSYTFTVTADKTLVANFTAAGVAKTISTSTFPSAGGTTNGSGTYLTGVIATLVATPGPGYVFSKWQDGETPVSSSPSYSFTVTGNRTLVAKFNEAFIIAASAAPAVGGRTEMDTLTPYKANENATAKAFPEPGWSFENWTENGTVVSTDISYDFNVSSNRTLVAHFTWDDGVTITTDPSSPIGGTTGGDGPYFVNDPVTVSAIAGEGYAFVGWTEDGVAVSSEADYAFTAEANRRLVAHFTPFLKIIASASPAEGGTVSGNGLFLAGDAASLTASANPGYAFHGWMENGASVDAPQQYDFTVTGTRTLVATFLALPPLVSAPAADGPPGMHAITISWPAPSAGWILEESADFMTWSPSARVIATINGRKTVTAETTGPGRFFRLAHP
jgi:uncharacterized repeat protein (TIGR02543 family)